MSFTFASLKQNWVSSLLTLLLVTPRKAELQCFLSSLWRPYYTNTHTHTKKERKISGLKSSSMYFSWDNSTYWSCHNLTYTGHFYICLGFVERREEGWFWGGAFFEKWRRGYFQNVWVHKDTLSAEISQTFLAVFLEEKIVTTCFCLSIQKLSSTEYFYCVCVLYFYFCITT